MAFHEGQRTQRTSCHPPRHDAEEKGVHYPGIRNRGIDNVLLSLAISPSPNGAHVCLMREVTHAQIRPLASLRRHKKIERNLLIQAVTAYEGGGSSMRNPE